MPTLPSFSRKSLLLLGFLFSVLLIIPLTVYLVGQQQDTQVSAAKETKLSFFPLSKEAEKDDIVTFDVRLNPGGNWVNFIKIAIKFDPTKLEPDGVGFEKNPSLTGWQYFVNPKVEGENKDLLTATMSVGSDGTQVIKTSETSIGKVSFKVIGEPEEETTDLSFDVDSIEINSVGGRDNFSENVFLSGSEANISIVGEVNPEPTTTPSATLTPTATATPTVDPTATPTTTPQTGGGGAPVCNSLIADQATTGEAPLALTFTAAGTDSDGTISKVDFVFENGETEEFSTGGGIGTKTVSAQLAHTFETTGTYNVTAQLVDDEGNMSNTCTATVTVTEAGVQPSEIPATGPSETLLGLGAAGGLLFLLGAFLFFIL